MIRIVLRAVCTILLEVATALLTIAIGLIVISAYVTARFVGVNIKTNKVASLVRVGHDLLAMAIDAKRKQVPDTIDVDES